MHPYLLVEDELMGHDYEIKSKAYNTIYAINGKNAATWQGDK